MKPLHIDTKVSTLPLPEPLTQKMPVGLLTLTVGEKLALQEAFTRFVDSGDATSRGYGINHPETDDDAAAYAANFRAWMLRTEPQNARKLTQASALKVVNAWYADDDPNSDSD
jgi:hypothetical protein